MEHPAQAPAFTPTIRTLRCGHTVWGKKTLKRPVRRLPKESGVFVKSHKQTKQQNIAARAVVFEKKHQQNRKSRCMREQTCRLPKEGGAGYLKTVVLGSMHKKKKHQRGKRGSYIARKRWGYASVRNKKEQNAQYSAIAWKDDVQPYSKHNGEADMQLHGSWARARGENAADRWRGRHAVAWSWRSRSIGEAKKGRGRNAVGWDIGEAGMRSHESLAER